MRVHAKPVGALGAAALAVAITVIAGCGDGSTPQQPATTTTTAPAATTTTASAAETAATTTAAPTTTTTAAPATTTTTETAAADTGAGSALLEAPVEADLGDIGVDTLWREVFDVLTASEQSCVREAVGAALETLLQARVLSENAELPEAEVFACLRPETSDAIWISALITGIAQEENVELRSAERSCMREQLAGLLSGEGLADLAALITQDGSVTSNDDLKTLLTATVVLFECVPDFFIREILSEAGIDPDELNEDETSCLRELAADLDDLDWPEISAVSNSEENYRSLVGTIESTGVAAGATVWFECIPDFFLQMILSGASIDRDELSEDEASCLRELLTDLGELDWPEISAASGSEENYGSPWETYFEIAAALPECLPERLLDGWTA